MPTAIVPLCRKPNPGFGSTASFLIPVLRRLLWSIVAGAGSQAQEPLTGAIYAHDPSTLIKDGSRYYYFRTDQGIGINWSTDLHAWNGGGAVFPGGPPAWTTAAVPASTGFFWAPDITFFNGQYYLYYSISEWGTIDSAIGLVTTPSLITPTWTDQGKVIQSDAEWDAGPDALALPVPLDPVAPSPAKANDQWSVSVPISDDIEVFRLRR